MASINLDLNYFDHPKTVRLVGLLGRGAEVLPIRLWLYCGRYHAKSGRLTGQSAQEIAAALRWWGDPIKAVEGLVKVGFLEQLEDGYQVHDWEEHAGHLVVYQERAKGAAKAKWEKYYAKLRETNKDDPIMLEASLKHATSMHEASLKQSHIISNQVNTKKSDFFNEAEKQQIFDALIESTSWGPSSKALQLAFEHVLSLTKKNSSENHFGYAMKCARNYGKPKKFGANHPEESLAENSP